MYDPNDTFVLGQVRLKGIRSAPWSSEKIPNLAEYRLVVLENVSLCKLIGDNLEWDDGELIARGRRLPGHVPRDGAAKQRLARLGSRLKRIRGDLIKLLASGGEVIAILDEQFFFRFSEALPLDWSPYQIAFKHEQGERIEVLDERFETYFAHVKRWPRLLDFSDEGWAGPIESHFRTDAHFSPQPIAKTRYGAPIAAALAFWTKATDWSGPMTCLLPPTECDTQQGVAIILREYAGIEFDLPDPEWLDTIDVPVLDKIDAARRSNLATMARLHKAQERLDQAAVKYRAPRRILFLPGIPLQQACAEVCSTIFGPVDPSIEDFIIPAEPDDVLVEVKGFDGSAKLGELAKVNTHIQEYEQSRQRTPKVVILVSQYREKEPKGRPPDTEYPDNVLDWAEKRSYSLVSVQELFKAYCAWRTGPVTREILLQRMLAGVGPTKLVMEGEEWVAPCVQPTS